MFVSLLQNQNVLCLFREFCAEDTYVPTNEFEVTLAAAFGHVSLVRHFIQDGKPVNSMTANYAAKYGDLAMIHALREKNVHCTYHGSNLAALCGHIEVIRDLRAHGIHCTSKAANYAAQMGHLEIVQDLREHGIHCTSKGADLAVRFGHLEVLRDLHAHNIYPHEGALKIAAEFGHLHIVRYFLLEHNTYKSLPGSEYMYRIDTSTVADFAAMKGHVQIVKFLREHDIHVTRHGILEAARHGHVNVLVELEENGMTISAADADRCFSHAVINGHLHMVRYLRSKGGDFDPQDVYAFGQAIRFGRIAVINDLLMHGVQPSHRAIGTAIAHNQWTLATLIEASGMARDDDDGYYYDS